MQSTCAICLDAVPPESEAFLDVCFHSFHLKCAKQWTAAQRRHPPERGPRFVCPLCKRPYYALVFDCHESAFRKEQVDQPPRGAALRPSAPTASFGQLNSGHRHRRSVYYSLPAGPCGAAGLAALPPGTLTERALSRADVACWTERELQALMWQDDVGLVAQHVLGTLRSAATATPATAAPAAPRQLAASGAAVRGCKAVGAGAASAGAGPTGAALPLKRKALALGPGRGSGSTQPAAAGADPQAVAAALARAAGPYVFEHAERFGLELVAFVASGLSLLEYDRQVLAHLPAGAAEAAAVARAAAAAAGGGGGGSGSPGGGSSGGGGGVQHSPHRSDSDDWAGSEDSEPEIDRGSSDEEAAGAGGYAAGGPLPQGEDTGGDYLELLLAQGHSRRPQQNAAAEAVSGSPAAAPNSADRTGAAAAASAVVGPSAADNPSRRQGQQQGQAAGAEQGPAGAADSRAAAELGDLRSRALKAMQAFRQGQQ